MADMMYSGDEVYDDEITSGDHEVGDWNDRIEEEYESWMQETN
jgi:hypothetical protein